MSKEDWEDAYEQMMELHVEHCKHCHDTGEFDKCEAFRQAVENVDDMYGSLMDKAELEMEASYEYDPGNVPEQK